MLARKMIGKVLIALILVVGVGVGVGVGSLLAGAAPNIPAVGSEPEFRCAKSRSDPTACAVFMR